MCRLPAQCVVKECLHRLSANHSLVFKSFFANPGMQQRALAEVPGSDGRMHDACVLMLGACDKPHVSMSPGPDFGSCTPPAYVLLHTVTRKEPLHGTRATYSALTVQHPHMVGNTAASPPAWRRHEQCNAGLHATACSQEIASQDVHTCMTFWTTPCACSM
jgi:hypothetical protein